MATIGSIPGLKKHYKSMPSSIRNYFKHIPKLLDDVSLSVALSYAFSQAEMAQNMALYCGLVKLHRANSDVAWNVLIKQHITRDGFRSLYKTVFNQEMPDDLIDTIKKAERVRDRVMHGKVTKDKEIRNAIAYVLDYTEGFNAAVRKIAHFEPCGDLRGFKGALAPLEKDTTRWMLKGMEFSVK